MTKHSVKITFKEFEVEGYVWVEVGRIIWHLYSWQTLKSRKESCHRLTVTCLCIRLIVSGRVERFYHTLDRRSRTRPIDVSLVVTRNLIMWWKITSCSIGWDATGIMSAFAVKHVIHLRTDWALFTLWDNEIYVNKIREILFNMNPSQKQNLCFGL